LLLVTEKIADWINTESTGRQNEIAMVRITMTRDNEYGTMKPEQEAVDMRLEQKRSTVSRNMS
jgi:hypothetical protein